MTKDASPRPDDSAEPGKNAASIAQHAVEEALFGIPDIPFDMDRKALGDRLRRAVQNMYAVLDSDVLAPVHYDGLSEGLALVRESRALLAASGDRSECLALGKALDSLDLAASALRLGADAVAQEQLARRMELRGGQVVEEAPKEKPFRASIGTPTLHAFARRPLVPELSLDPLAPPPEKPAPAQKLKAPKTVEELKAFAGAAAGLEKKLDQEKAEDPGGGDALDPIFLHEPALEEAEMLRRLGRDCLEDMAILSDLRKPNAIESWLDQAPFEQRLLDNLDCFASVGGAALPLVSLFFAEAKAPDPGRAFAVALVLGSIEGRDTVDAAIATLKQSAKETYPGWVDGLWLAPNPAIDGALIDLAAGPRTALGALALEVLVLRQTLPFEVAAQLAVSDRVELAEHAARALGAVGPRDEALDVLEGVLARTDSNAVFAAAAEAAMQRGHGPTRTLLRQILAVSGDAEQKRTAAWLLCLGGHEDDLQALLTFVAASPDALVVRGLGRFGHVGALDALVGLLVSDNELVVEAAAEALDRITGAGLREIVEEPWEVEIPPEIDLTDVPPMPTRRVEKVIVDPATWQTWIRQNRARFDPKVRYRGGAPFFALHLVDELESKQTPPARRPEAALELWIASGIVSPFSPHDWVARQKGHLGELRARVSAAGLPVGEWMFGMAREARPAAAKSLPQGKVGMKRTMAFSLPADLRALPFATSGLVPSPPGSSPPAERPADTSALPFVQASAPRPPVSETNLTSTALPFSAAPPGTAPMPALATPAAPATPPAVPFSPPSPVTAQVPPVATPAAPPPLPAPRAPVAAPPVVAPPPVAMPSAPAFDAGATVQAAMSPFHVPKAPASALPFQSDITGPPAPSPIRRGPPETEGLPFRQVPNVPAPPRSDLSGTRSGLPFTPKPEATPVPAQAAPPRPALTLEQYAWLCARRAVEPHKMAEHLAHYRIFSEEAFRAVELEFQRRFAAEPGSHERFSALVRHYSR